MSRRPETLFEHEIAAFEDEIAAEIARKAQVAGLENGPKKYHLLKRIRNWRQRLT